MLATAAATAATQAAAVQQPYNYMFYQQQGQPGQQTGQTAGQQQQQQQQQQQYDYNTYNRYQYPAATSQGNYYQQTIPNQLSQPQPQHYNGSNRNYTSAPSGAPYLPILPVDLHNSHHYQVNKQYLSHHMYRQCNNQLLFRIR